MPDTILAWIWQTGVDPGVTAVVQALHAEAQGQYETAFGLTKGFPMKRGNGQGCVNGAVRSKLQLTVVQRLMATTCKGYRFHGRTEGGGVGVCFFADDAAFLSDSLAGLQQMYDCCWLVSAVCGLRMTIKGKRKTAFMATEYKDGKEYDIVDTETDGWRVRLMNGEEVPQILRGGGNKTCRKV